jgi:hypothetical protein
MVKTPLLQQPFNHFLQPQRGAVLFPFSTSNHVLVEHWLRDRFPFNPMTQLHRTLWSASFRFFFRFSRLFVSACQTTCHQKSVRWSRTPANGLFPLVNSFGFEFHFLYCHNYEKFQFLRQLHLQPVDKVSSAHMKLLASLDSQVQL